MTKGYDDIINLPRHVSKRRPQMPVINRAAQFSPFAALTGHDASIKETARLTSERIELDDNMKDALDYKLQIIANHLGHSFKVKITYFKPDEKKDGGSYVTYNGIVKKIDEYKKNILMIDGVEISIKEIINIDW
ncbi:MAG: YolD-like family protein [Tissierellia bacterium]|nr:YolD-like family protein [Tissierellia bacterium]